MVLNAESRQEQVLEKHAKFHISSSKPLNCHAQSGFCQDESIGMAPGTYSQSFDVVLEKVVELPERLLVHSVGSLTRNEVVFISDGFIALPLSWDIRAPKRMPTRVRYQSIADDWIKSSSSQSKKLE